MAISMKDECIVGRHTGQKRLDFILLAVAENT